MSDGPLDNAVSEPRRNRSPWTAAALVLIMLLAALVRIYGLGRQSTWWDDYNSVAYLDASDLRTYLAAVDEMNEMHVPLYFVMQYAWGQWVGQSPLRVRLLSVCLGLLALPFVYLLGRDAFGKGAGLVAAICFALSPTHVFHGQAMRPYSLMVLLAAVSLYTLMRASRDNKWPWWVANVVTNILLVETHLFAVVLLFTEGCFLVLFFRGRVRQTVAWIAVHGLAFGLLTVWLHGALSVAGGWYNDMCPAPSLSQFLFDLAGDDAVGLNNELLFSVDTWGFIPQRLALMFHAVHGRFDYALLLAFGACLVWMGWRTWTLAAAVYRDPGNQAARRGLEGSVLFLMVVVVPVAGLAIVSHLWRPAIFPRYTIYSSIALYAIVGGAVAAISDSVLRRLAVGALVVLYAYQLSWTLPATTRTDWRGAADHITANASPDDVILVASDSGTAYSAMSLFYFNADTNVFPVLPADSIEAACVASVCFVRPRGSEATRDVWVVFHRKYVGGPLNEFEDGLAARGLRFSYTEFPSMRKLSVYRVMAGPDSESGVTGAACALAYAASAQSLAYFAMEQAQRCDYDSATAALDTLGEMREEYLPVFQALVTASCSEDAAPSALEALRKLFDWRGSSRMSDDAGPARPDAGAVPFPDHDLASSELTSALLYYGIALASLGEDQGLAVLRTAVEMEPAFKTVYGSLVKAVERRENLPTALAAARALVKGYELRRTGQFDSAIAEFRRATELKPDYAIAFAELGVLLAQRADHDDALRVLRRAVDIEPTFGSLYGSLIEAIERNENIQAASAAARALEKGYELLRSGQLDLAIAQFRSAAELDPGCTGAWHALARVLLDKQDYDGALPVLRRIVASNAGDALLYGHVADVVERKGDVRAAVDALGLLLKGIEQGEAGDQAGAVAKFQEAVALDPDYSTPYVALGFRMLQLGDTQGCMRQMRKAFAVDPDLVGQWEPFLVALLETEDHDTARVEAERLKDMNIFVPLEFLDILEGDSRHVESE